MKKNNDSKKTASQASQQPSQQASQQEAQKLEPSLEQWKELYEITNKIKLMTPWKHLWDADLITIAPAGYKEPVYCSIMGKNDETYAIGLYHGNEGLASYNNIMSHPEEPALITGFQQKCLICYYGNREELLPKDREIIKSLGIKFRGRNAWTYFRSFDPGFYPWHIDAEQADYLIIILKSLYEALTYLFEEKPRIDFDKGESLLYEFSVETQQWTYGTSLLPNVLIKAPSLPLNIDELQVMRLKNKKKTQQFLEFDIIYFPIPIQENRKIRPYLPRMCILADSISGLMVDQYMIDPEASVADHALGMLVKHINEYGKPLRIFTRNEAIGCYIRELCRKIDIELIEDAVLITVNDLFENMLDYLDERF